MFPIFVRKKLILSILQKKKEGNLTDFPSYAESEGFEPPVRRNAYTAFRVRLFRPLRQLSNHSTSCYGITSQGVTPSQKRLQRYSFFLIYANVLRFFLFFSLFYFRLHLFLTSFPFPYTIVVRCPNSHDFIHSIASDSKVQCGSRATALYFRS